MTGNLLVTPEKLISTADDFDAVNSQVRTLTQQMIDTINSLSSTWAGEAATAYNSKFLELNDDMEKISRMITEHANDLKEMANNYKTAESSNVETASTLAGDVIS